MPNDDRGNSTGRSGLSPYALFRRLVGSSMSTGSKFQSFRLRQDSESFRSRFRSLPLSLGGSEMRPQQGAFSGNPHPGEDGLRDAVQSPGEYHDGEVPEPGSTVYTVPDPLAGPQALYAPVEGDVATPVYHGELTEGTGIEPGADVQLHEGREEEYTEPDSVAVSGRNGMSVSDAQDSVATDRIYDGVTAVSPGEPIPEAKDLPGFNSELAHTLQGGLFTAGNFIARHGLGLVTFGVDYFKPAYPAGIKLFKPTVKARVQFGQIKTDLKRHFKNKGGKKDFETGTTTRFGRKKYDKEGYQAALNEEYQKFMFGIGEFPGKDNSSGYATKAGKCFKNYGTASISAALGLEKWSSLGEKWQTKYGADVSYSSEAFKGFYQEMKELGRNTITHHNGTTYRCQSARQIYTAVTMAFKSDKKPIRVRISNALDPEEQKLQAAAAVEAYFDTVAKHSGLSEDGGKIGFTVVLGNKEYNLQDPKGLGDLCVEVEAEIDQKSYGDRASEARTHSSLSGGGDSSVDAGVDGAPDAGNAASEPLLEDSTAADLARSAGETVAGRIGSGSAQPESLGDGGGDPGATNDEGTPGGNTLGK